MKNINIILLIMGILLSGQSMNHVNAYFGLQTGFNYSTYDPDDEAGTFTGTGFQIGLGMGVDVNTFGVRVAPVFKTTSFNRTIINIETGANYNNLFLPVSLQLKAGMVPIVSPYLSAGLAGNFQLDGTAYIGSLKSSIDDLENDLLLSLALGTDIKVTKLWITPEFSFNYNLTAEDSDTQNRAESSYDLSFSVGIYYAP